MKTELTLNETETVAAGTVGEMEELVSALVDNGFICAVSVAASHTPGLNNLQMDSVVSDLKKLGVRAEIDLGWAGTGIGSEANKYYSIADGHSMTHQEVLNVINNR